MSEIITEITEPLTPVYKTFSIGSEETCCICDTEFDVSGDTEKELFENIKKAGWKNLESDQYGIIGYWCGCEYSIENNA